MKYIVAENYLCFLSLLEMIIKDATAFNINQYDIAEELGIVVPYNYNIKISNIKYSNIDNDYGVNLSEEILQRFFTKKGIGLRTKYVDGLRINELEFDSELDKYIKEGKYVIFAFSYGFLYNLNNSITLGHAVLLEKVLDDNTIEIYDPGPDGSGHKKISILKMCYAMRIKGGIYIIDIIKHN